MTGCAAVAVSRDYAPSIDFTAYRTYALRSASARESEPRSLIDQRAQAAVERALAQKGLHRVGDAESPDLLAIVRFETRMWVGVVPYTAYGGYWGWRWGWGYPGYGWNTWAESYTEGTLDLVDAKSNDVVWRGRAQRATADTELSAAKVEEMVTKLLEDFPPGSAKK
jgi:hypothetical protein